jgi:hypothetical protein
MREWLGVALGAVPALRRKKRPVEPRDPGKWPGTH